ncbi:MAG TPA: hypothetical protein VM621_11285 [Luteibacter sp.]|uniref:hypothetical protein n=1 Tax=Luteibacter sp. TaxID=1886636 RepID=UPI002BC78F34|nr:hypothetical protein [Luteibacter sp.]HVI55614.1 hypothetical protein [Luteibacter sp.]
MNRFTLSLLAAAALCVSAAASAGDGSGNITRLTAYGTAVIFTVESHPSPAPCGPGGAFVINASTPEGKTMYATLLTAIASSRPISVYGSNTCPSYWGDSELSNSVTIAM